MEITERSTEQSNASKSTWEELYIISEHWRSSIEFYKDEIRFMLKLTAKITKDYTEPNDRRAAELIVVSLTRMNRKLQEIDFMIKRHMKHYPALLGNVSLKTDAQYRAEHASLEVAIAKQSKHFRKLKTKIFEMSEHILAG